MVIFHSYVKLPEGTPLSVTSGGAKKLSADALNGMQVIQDVSSGLVGACQKMEQLTVASWQFQWP